MRNRKGKVVTAPDVVVGAAGMRMMRLLVGNPPQTVTDLVRASGVTRTAVKEQLNDLVRAGLAECSHGTFARPRPPAFRYTATTVRPGAAVCQQPTPGGSRHLAGAGGGGRAGVEQEGPPPRQPRPGRTLQRQDHRHRAAAAAATVHRTAPRRGRAAGTPPRTRPPLPLQAELPLHRHVRRVAQRLLRRSGHDPQRGPAPRCGRPPAATTANLAASSNWQTAAE